MKSRTVLVSLVLGLGLALAVSCLLGGEAHQVTLAQSASGVIRVATLGSDTADCGSAGSPCRTVQYAVDQALPGEEIRVAEGVYTGVQNIATLNTATFTATQVVAIVKNLTIRGGYTTENWAAPDPTAHPTTFDAEELGRVLVITGPITATIEGLQITGGSASGLGGGLTAADGGGVYIYGATVTVSNCVIYGNFGSSQESDWETASGGGLYLEGSSQARLLRNTFSRNTATPRGHGYGGGLVLADSPHALLRGNVITGNVGTLTSNGQGGGIYLSSSHDLILDSNVIVNNVGSGGANYYGGGLYLLRSDRAMLTKNVIEGNLGGGAYSWGGGLFLDLSHHVTLVGNIIQGNVASTYRGWGGGLYSAGCGDLALDGNMIAGNAGTSDLRRSSWGGGLYIERGGAATLTNNAIIDNQATSSGSGLLVAGGSPRMLHNTIARNSGGDGSGIYVDRDEHWSGDYFGTVAMTNTIIVEHGVGISVTGGNTVTVNGVLWHDTPVTVSSSPTAVVSIQNEHTGDPVFAADGYHLTGSSAAVDEGVDARITIDIDGDPRPARLKPDLGADELWQRVFLPLVVRSP